MSITWAGLIAPPGSAGVAGHPAGSCGNNDPHAGAPGLELGGGGTEASLATTRYAYRRCVRTIVSLIHA